MSKGERSELRAWSRFGYDRVYVGSADGESVGYLDLSDGRVHVVEGHTEDEVLVPLARVLPDSRRERLLTPWRDLARNEPGASLRGLDGQGYRKGMEGEQRTAGMLSVAQNFGYRLLHSLPLTETADLDHLVVGPTGVFAINTKATGYRVRFDGHSVLVDGYEKNWRDSAAHGAALASQRLSAATRMDVRAYPLVAVWSPFDIETEPEGVEVPVVAAEKVLGPITARSKAFDPAWCEAVYAVARRSDTWDPQAHADF